MHSFLANSSHEAGVWFTTTWISVSLRLELSILQCNFCVCGEKFDKYARHGLYCAKASGTRSRHGSVKNIVQRELKSADVPSIREPPGCSKPDGKKTDGMSLTPWASWKSLWPTVSFWYQSQLKQWVFLVRWRWISLRQLEVWLRKKLMKLTFLNVLHLQFNVAMLPQSCGLFPQRQIWVKFSIYDLLNGVRFILFYYYINTRLTF